MSSLQLCDLCGNGLDGGLVTLWSSLVVVWGLRARWWVRLLGRHGCCCFAFCRLGTVGFEVTNSKIVPLMSSADYLHMTKRFGIVAASQLPFHYLLSLKSPYSPLQILTRSSHETLNALHQLLGRIVTVLLYFHAALYINFYVQKGLLASKIQEAYVLCGIFGILAFTAVGTTALAPVRKWSYRVFYITHVTLATAILPVLFFHVSHIRIYLYETAVIYALNVLLRTISSRQYEGTIRLMPNTNLIEVTIPLPPAGRGKQTIPAWQPGQHAYVSLAGPPLLRTFRSNPFTVASIPSVDGKLTFVARVLDGNTAKLAQATGHQDTKSTQRLTIEGPYGVATHADRLLQYDRVLLVAGGIGATFIVPLYRQLLADLSPSKGSYRRQKVSFVWAARGLAEVMWALPEDSREREGFVERLSVCLTNAGEDSGVGAFMSGDEGGEKERIGEADTSIELEEQKQLLTEEADGSGGDMSSVSTYYGRPKLERLVQQTFAHGSAEKVAIVVCGPTGLTRGLRKEVAPWVYRGRDVWFWEEAFAL